MDCEGAATSLGRATPLPGRPPGRPILALVLHDRADTPQSTGVRLIMRCIEQLAIAVIALECAPTSPLLQDDPLANLGEVAFCSLCPPTAFRVPALAHP